MLPFFCLATEGSCGTATDEITKLFPDTGIGTSGLTSQSKRYERSNNWSERHCRQRAHGSRNGLSGEEAFSNTPGTAGGPGGRDRTLAVKSRKTAKK